MADLALRLVDGTALLFRGALRQRGNVFFKLQLQHGWKILRDDIKSAVRWIHRRPAPIGSSVVARHLHRVAGPGRSKQSLIAGTQQLVTEASALCRVDDIRAQIIRGKFLPREGRWLGWKRLRGPSLLARHVGARHWAFLDGP